MLQSKLELDISKKAILPHQIKSYQQGGNYSDIYFVDPKSGM